MKSTLVILLTCLLFSKSMSECGDNETSETKYSWIKRTIESEYPGLPDEEISVQTITETWNKATVEIHSTNSDDFSVHYHPYGYTRVKYTENVFGEGKEVKSDEQTPSHQFLDCCDCGDNENAGYSMKIFSSQDPRTSPFDKPILVLQGFDPDFGTSKPFSYREFKDQLNSLIDESTGNDVTDDGLLATLYAEGYDVALLLFKNPHIKIETNANVVLKAWKWLQDHSLQAYGSEPIIIGPSMGGLIARYAVQQQGRQQFQDWNGNFDDNELFGKLLIAFDAPNRGADIPMSIQAGLVFLRKHSSEARSLLNNLRSTAATQMLLKSVRGRVDSEESHEVSDYESQETLHGKFMSSLNDPEFVLDAKGITAREDGGTCYREDRRCLPLRTVAISSGSGNMEDYGLSENHEYASTEYPWYDPGPDINMKTSSTSSLVKVFYGDTPDSWDWHYNFQEPVFIENVPGGSRTSYNQFRVALEDADYDWDFWDIAYELHPFIPMVSSIGLLGIDINNQSDYFVPVPAGPIYVNLIGHPYDPVPGDLRLGTSLFDELFVPRHNQEHVRITPEIKNYILDLLSRF